MEAIPHRSLQFVSVAAVLVFLPAAELLAADVVTVNRQGRTFQVAGRIVVEAQDGGLLLLADNGRLWAVQPDEIAGKGVDSDRPEVLSRKSIGKQLLQEMPGFELHETANYLICHNTSSAYATWVGALFERLDRGFENYWGRKGLKIAEPDSPLVALIFKDKPSYVQYAKQELGESAEGIVGYYSLTTNRIAMYDLTGVAGRGRYSGRLGTSAEINRLLSTPGAQHMVATVVHEATHQLAYNRGLHLRWQPIPIWVSEGIAMFFETPDLRSSRGWRTIGAVNRARLTRFKRLRAATIPLESLISNEDLFQSGETAADAYAVSWALTYYLLKQSPDAYVAYLDDLSKQKPLAEPMPADRRNLFRKHFGEPGTVEQQLHRAINRLR